MFSFHVSMLDASNVFLPGLTSKIFSNLIFFFNHQLPEVIEELLEHTGTKYACNPNLWNITKYKIFILITNILCTCSPFRAENHLLNRDGFIEADGDPRRVEDKEHDDGDDQNNRQVTVFSLLVYAIWFWFSWNETFEEWQIN